MSSDTAETFVRTEITVEVPLERAFRVFVERFDQIKPREHNMLGVGIAQSVFEPKVGGRIYDRGVDGSECQWGRVLVYETPTRLVFSWDISPHWQIENDPARSSKVEVRFIADGERRTRVELEHRHLERHGEGWQDLAAGVKGDQGWPLYLLRFAEASR